MLLINQILILAFSMLSIAAFCLRDKWKLWMKIAITLVVFLIAPIYIVYYGECMIGGPKQWFGKETLFSNCMILYFLMLGLLLLTQSPKWTIRIASIAVGILYIADFFVLRFRGSTMKIWDIMAAGTAKEVAGNYSYKISDSVLVLIVFLVFLWSVSYSFPVLKCQIRYRALMAFAGILYCIWMCQYIRQDSFWSDLKGVRCAVAFDAETSYRRSGHLASLLFQLKVSGVAEPENYQKEEAARILAKYEERGNAEVKVKVKGKKPHIIVVVNESLADLAVWGDVLEEESLAYMKSLHENTVKGYVNVSVLGGGTCDSEFEFLTGNSMAFLPSGVYPFHTINQKQKSLVWDLRELGYETYAMHPAPASNWNRKKVYPLLGFQHNNWIEAFQEAETVHMGASDRETYQKIMEIFENRKAGETQFIYDMTLQNHGGYDKIDVKEVIESAYSTVSEYLSLMRYSDRALKELIEYFDSQREDVVLCIFGDHQPALEEAFYEDIFAGNGKTEQENFLSKYKTPFWIWANYDIEEKENIEISLNYLSGLLLETIGLPKSPYMRHVSEMRKEYPVLTVNGYQDADGVFHAPEKMPASLEEYKRVQYYYMYDGQYLFEDEEK